MKYLKVLLLSVMIMGLVGCGSSSSEEVSHTVTCSEKDELMENEAAILVDVRTESEYEKGHLDEAINLEYETIADTIGDYAGIDSVIIVYCRSGTRSNMAYESLVDAGYNNVYDLGAMSNCE